GPPRPGRSPTPGASATPRPSSARTSASGWPRRWTASPSSRNWVEDAPPPGPKSMETGTHWAILTGEYPPQPGGVADYTASVARGLAVSGDGVTVFAPAAGAGPDVPGVTVRRLAGGFGPRSLAVLGRELDHWPGRVLLQYAPHAFGCKGMNVP